MNYIPKKDYVHLAPQGKDEYVTVNHTDCTAGQDSRTRLWIKNDGKTIVAYCHNCGLKGFSKMKPFLIPHIDKPAMKKRLEVGDLISVPTKYRLWFYDYGLANDDIDYMWQWSEKLHRVVAMTLNDDFSLTYICRAVERLQVPKYLTIGKKSAWICDMLPVVGDYELSKTTLVVVEDMLSAFKITKATKVPTLALLGTYLKSQDYPKLLKYDKIIIWLDGDKAGQTASKKLLKTIANIRPDVRVIKTPGDPKDYQATQYEFILSL